MFRRHRVIALAFLIIAGAIILWAATPSAKDIVTYATDTLLILSIAIAFIVYWDWQRFNVNNLWWIWDITFWNKRGVILSKVKLPIIIVHLVIVNPYVFTIVVEEMTLTINDAKDESKVYRLTACALSNEQVFEVHDTVSDKIPIFKPASPFFNPIIVEPRSKEIVWVVLMSPTDEPKKLEDMLSEGAYNCKLELMTDSDPPISLDFPLDIDSSRREEYTKGKCRIDIRAR